MKTLWSTSEQRAVSFQDVWGRGLDIGATRTAANVPVNASTALGLSAVFACTRVLADAVSTLPLHAYRDSSGGRMEMPAQPLLVAKPSMNLSREEWLHQAMVSLLLWGNAYGVVLTRDRLGVPQTVEWVNPDSVSVKQPSALRAPTYELSGDLIDADDIVHVRAFIKPGSVVGSAPLTVQQETFGLGIAAQKFGAQWFGSGGHPSGILMSDQQVDQEVATTIKERFVAAIKGRQPAVLGAGLKYQAIQVAPNESQFLETQQAVRNEIAAVFGVPPEMIGGSGSGSSVTYANREQAAIDFLTFSVNPWLVRLERAMTALLPRGQFVKFNPDALLRTDTKTRYQAHRLGLDGHFITIDEVRDIEDRRPLDNGEQFPPTKASGQEVDQ